MRNRAASAIGSRPATPTDAGPSSMPHIVIRPKGRFSLFDVGQLWDFRDLVIAFALRDIKLRYRQTALGVIWVAAQPLMGAATFAFVFGHVAHLKSNGVPYLAFAFAGLVGWNLFSGIVTRASTSLSTYGSMLSRIYFPRAALPLAVLGSALLDCAVTLALQAVLLGAYGIAPTWRLFLLPAWVGLVVCLAAGVGLVTSSLSARYRDVPYIIPVVLQLMTVLSPVGYDVASVPGSGRWAVELNPLTGILQGFRWSLLGRGSLTAGALLLSVTTALTTLLIGAVVFSSFERGLADVI